MHQTICVFCYEAGRNTNSLVHLRALPPPARSQMHQTICVFLRGGEMYSTFCRLVKTQKVWCIFVVRYVVRLRDAQKHHKRRPKILRARSGGSTSTREMMRPPTSGRGSWRRTSRSTRGLTCLRPRHCSSISGIWSRDVHPHSWARARPSSWSRT